jgi:hypothetical protein
MGKKSKGVNAKTTPTLDLHDKDFSYYTSVQTSKSNDEDF